MPHRLAPAAASSFTKKCDKRAEMAASKQEVALEVGAVGNRCAQPGRFWCRGWEFHLTGLPGKFRGVVTRINLSGRCRHIFPLEHRGCLWCQAVFKCHGASTHRTSGTADAKKWFSKPFPPASSCGWMWGKRSWLSGIHGQNRQSTAW